AGRVAEQAVNARAVPEHLRQQAHAPQHLQAAGLEQEAGAHRPRRGHAFEHGDVVSVARKQHGGGLPGGAVADDGDTQLLHALPLLPCRTAARGTRESTMAKTSSWAYGATTKVHGIAQ